MPWIGLVTHVNCKDTPATITPGVNLLVANVVKHPNSRTTRTQRGVHKCTLIQNLHQTRKYSVALSIDRVDHPSDCHKAHIRNAEPPNLWCKSIPEVIGRHLLVSFAQPPHARLTAKRIVDQAAQYPWPIFRPRNDSNFAQKPAKCS